MSNPTSTPEKGDLLGICNRTACNNKGARFFNHATQKHYCTKCAHDLNTYNPESKEIYGHDLCTLVPVSEEDYLDSILTD